MLACNVLCHLEKYSRLETIEWANSGAALARRKRCDLSGMYKRFLPCNFSVWLSLGRFLGLGPATLIFCSCHTFSLACCSLPAYLESRDHMLLQSPHASSKPNDTPCLAPSVLPYTLLLISLFGIAVFQLSFEAKAFHVHPIFFRSSLL